MAASKTAKIQLRPGDLFTWGACMVYYAYPAMYFTKSEADYYTSYPLTKCFQYSKPNIKSETEWRERK